ncbi:MAG: hypothetical protein KDA91_20870 [Planctomycetaceae bacterium]|nr:hypothetical protein [Planctomycetaceae bacterium]
MPSFNFTNLNRLSDESSSSLCGCLGADERWSGAEKLRLNERRKNGTGSYLCDEFAWKADG